MTKCKYCDFKLSSTRHTSLRDISKLIDHYSRCHESRYDELDEAIKELGERFTDQWM